MRFVVTSEQMKKAEELSLSKGIYSSHTELMEAAGTECYKKIAHLTGEVKDKAFTVLCGRGNNGGDGIVLAQRLKENGGEVLCVFASDLPNTKSARECYSKYCESKEITENENESERINVTLYTHREETVKKALLNCDVIVDCVFGTGFYGSLEPKLSSLFRFINNNCSALKISVDVPSGVDADTGEISEGAFRPEITLMLGAAKPGLLSHPCFDFCGNLVLLNIGLTEECFTEYAARLTGADIMRYIPRRVKSSHKGDYGRLLNIAGSERYIGAALLSTKAALKSGAGNVTLASPKNVCFSAAPAIPESTFLPLSADENGFIGENNTDLIIKYMASCTAVSIGCGLGITEETRKLTENVLENAVCPIILDADGINIVAANINVLKDNDKPVILTPHPLELSRMTSANVKEIQANRIEYASRYAKEWNCVLVLKGVNTVIAAPDGRISVNTTGNAGLAKGGSGDVLTGIIASFAAQGVMLFEAAVLGAFIHGQAADEMLHDVAPSGIMPSDIADILPFVMKTRNGNFFRKN